MFTVGILLGLVLLFGPFVVPSSVWEVDATSKVMLAFFGVAVLLGFGFALIITRLYKKSSSDMAFVRTGMGGSKAVLDGGCVVVPLLHNVRNITLQTIEAEVERNGEKALQTSDIPRADVKAVFYIRVGKNAEMVTNAANTLGEKAANPDLIKRMVEGKLEGALRDVAKTRTFDDLNGKRSEFASAVQTALRTDLDHNGLMLETVTIPFFDQTPTQYLKPESNIVDAHGMQRITQITQDALVEINRMEREAEKAKKDQNVETSQYLFARDVEMETAKVEKDKRIRIATEQAAQEGQTYAITQQKTVEVAEVERQQAVRVAEVEREKTFEVANANRVKDVETAKIESEQAVELALREKQITINEAETRRAIAEAARLIEEAHAEQNRQTVRTVEVTAVAEREKQKAVIEAEARAEQEKRQLNMQVDIAAYRVTQLADAERKSAENKATAVRTEADAKRDALVAQAAGQQALEMVPVTVERERVAVGREDLKNKAEFEKISSGLTVRLAEIEASRDVHIATANAVGQAMANAKLTLWGTPEQAVHMTQAWMKGQGIGTLVDGLLTSVAGEGGNSLANITELIKGVVGQFAGVNASPHSGDTTHTSEDPKHN